MNIISYFNSRYATLIQYSWKSYKCRKIAKIFRQLPYDIQTKIVWYIQEPYLIQKYHHQPITKVILSKTESSIINYTINENIDWKDHVCNIKNLCHLYKKYNSIIPYDDKKDFVRNIFSFIGTIRPIIYGSSGSDSESLRYISHILSEIRDLLILKL
jgi:hypothetical protein